MNKATKQEIKEKVNRERTLVSSAIFYGLAIFILFLESIITLVSFAWKGVFKKEILSKNSNLGFDIDIILKE
ncbi:MULTISPECIES: hypothetical protein [Prochlorococcus]|uniref:hypothetical protein n=1 Tax=Prochlorococcus TaxID=1218 RepID=UPI000533707B|nr:MULTISPECIES: hypothetical protein [Prochlorococcus]KGG12202.1 hypothetical protein EV05_1408 [Prochlorococcus sp. MIT 0601]